MKIRRRGKHSVARRIKETSLGKIKPSGRDRPSGGGGRGREGGGGPQLS